MVSTAPAPESCPNCQPATIRPMLFKLFAMQNHGYQATANYVQLFSRFATSHLECKHVSFGPHGIFCAAQSDAIFGAISQLMLLDDKEDGQSFHDPSILDFLPSDFREKRATLAGRITEWIVYSLSPMCETLQPSMLSGLESLVDSTVELQTPPARRLSPELKEQFVLLLRRALFLGSFSLRMAQEDRYRFPIRDLSHDSLQLLADLEPDLVVPEALKNFYVSQNSKVDGDAAYMILCLLQQLSNIMWLSLAEKSNSDSSVDAEHSTQWGNGEMERLYKAGSEVKVAYGKELSDHDESTLLRSAATRVPGFARQFLRKALGFLVQAYRSVDRTLTSAAQDDSELDAATSDLADAACECLRLLSRDQLKEVMLEIVKKFLSTPLPQASSYAARILKAAVLQHPDGCLAIFIPELITKIKDELGDEWNDASRRHTSLSSLEYNLH
ncbi:hypothetical protein CLAIMM_15098 [Cladophialophora immunda]|nr:hypothetical protein CLAIMM_15098 [Cladophialophora immunda]